MELSSIVNKQKYNPSIDTIKFPGTPSNDFWSSSSYASYTFDAWYVDFNYGDVSYNYKTDNYNARCVRSGP